MNEQKKQPTGPLKDTLLARIESEKVCPHSRLFFMSREFLVRTLWFFSVVVGAFAVAVTLFAVVHNQYALYEATHENFVTFVIEALPYLWILTFAIMVFTAVYNIRHTKHGYRYPLWVIMGSSVVLSFAGGSALQLFGFGYELDELLGKHMMLYTSQQKFEQRLWLDPADGRLLGRQTYRTLSPTTTVIFEDASGQPWTMDISELPPQDLAALDSQETVRLLGKSTDEELRQFHACAVLDWERAHEATIEEMSQDRQNFLERIARHAERADRARVEMRGRSFASTTLSAESVCSTIAPVRRLPAPPREDLEP